MNFAFAGSITELFDDEKLFYYKTAALRLSDTFSTGNIGTFVTDEETHILFVITAAGSGAGVMEQVWPPSPALPGPLPSAFAMFYGLTAGTGNGGPTDYAGTIAVKTSAGTGRVPFPRLGPLAGGIAAPLPAAGDGFTIPVAGNYEVSFQVHTTEPGQLQLELDGASLPETTAVNMNTTSGGHPIIGHAYITTVTPNQVLAVINPPGNTPALTITPADGSDTHANSQILTIKRI